MKKIILSRLLSESEIRLLLSKSPPDLPPLSAPSISVSDLANEEAIRWLQSFDGLSYVRQTLVAATSRRRAISWHRRGRVIGYGILADDAPHCGIRGRFLRRVFWLKETDRGEPGGNYFLGCPSEAVDPRTVHPGEPGKKTPTCVRSFSSGIADFRKLQAAGMFAQAVSDTMAMP